MNRNVWIGVAVVAVVAIAIVVGLRLADQTASVASPTVAPAAATTARASAAASATPTATGGPSAAGPTAPTGGPAAVSNDDFGFLVLDVGISGTIRKESSTTRIGSADGIAFAISPDGRQVAYWTTGNDQQLRMFPAAEPSRQQALVTLSTEHGVGVAWAGDGSGLLYSVATGGGFGQVDSAALHTFDLRGTTQPDRTVLTSTEPGKVLQPIAWDRATNIAAAGVTGDGGFMMEYLVVSTATPQAAPKRTAVLGRNTMSTVRASSDAKLVLGVDLDSGEAWFWPIADYGARKAASGNGKFGALWQPGSHKIGVLTATTNDVVLFQADDGSVTTVVRGAKANSFVRAFRADGSAIVLAIVAAGTAPNDYTLYRLSDAASVTFQDVGGLSGSVRLR